MSSQEYRGTVTEVQKIAKSESKEVKLALYRVSDTHTRARIFIGDDVAYERVTEQGSERPALHVIISNRVIEACYPYAQKMDDFPVHNFCSKIRQMFLSAEDAETSIDSEVPSTVLIFA